MGYSDKAAELGRLQRIAKGWAAAGKMDIIERDLVLQRLKELYEQVLFSEATAKAAGPYVRRTAVPLEPVEEIEEFNAAAVREPASEDAFTERNETASVETECFAPASPLSAGESQRPSEGAAPSFVPDDMPRTGAGCRHPLDKRAIRSLYESDEPVSAAEAAPSIRWSVGINDRCLLIRDLFAGDAGECDRTLEDIDRMPDMNQALVYIADRYDWNPDSEGARMFVRLLNARFS